MKRILSAARCALSLLAVSASVEPFAAPSDFTPDAVLGKPGFTAGANGVVSATNMLWVSALAEDPISGELWVVDHMGSRVLRFASAHAFTNGEAANLVLGQPDFISDRANRGGAVAANTLNRPVGVAVDEARRVYVSDMENNRVLVFHPPFTNGMDARQVGGQLNFTSGAPNQGQVDNPSASSLYRPHGLALDHRGRLWVADLANARVLRFDMDRGGSTFIFASLVIGQGHFYTRQPSLTAAGLSQPAGIAFDRLGRLWVADQAFHRVTRYPAADQIGVGEAAQFVQCQPDFTTAVGQAGATGCFMPTTIAFDDRGRHLVGDFGNHRLLRFPADAIAGSPPDRIIGQADAASRDCNRGAAAPTADTFCGPRAMAFDRHGDLLVADAGNGRVLRYDLPEGRGAPQVVATSPVRFVASAQGAELALVGSNFYADAVVFLGNSSLPVRYISPRRLAVTLAPGDLAAPGALSLRLFVPSPGGGVASVTVPVEARQAGDGAPDRVLGQSAIVAAVKPPAGGEMAGVINASQLRAPSGVAIDPVSGRLFVADADAGRVLSWPDYSAFQNAQAADVVLGVPDGYSVGNVGSSARALAVPRGLALDPAGRLYVADEFQHRVLRFDPPFATGMAASHVFGQQGSFVTSARGAGPEGLDSPYGLAFAGGKLFVADNGNNRVLVFDNPDAATAAAVVIGQPDMNSTRLRLGSAGLSGPTKMAVDALGRLYVSDTLNHRVLRFAPPFANGMAASLVIGQLDFDTDISGISDRRLYEPNGLAIDPEGNLVVADRGNHRILRFAAPLSTAMAASAVLGQPSFDSDNPNHPDGPNEPDDVAVDASGNVLVADTGNGRLVAYDRPFGVETTKRLVNIATRMPVLQGDDVLIGGFIIGGTAPKKVVVRARGPSLGAFGIANPLANPLLQLFSGANAIAANDNWQQAANVAEIQASGFAPAHPFESAILMTLEPGAYTAIVSGAGGVTGVGIVEVFEVDGAASPLVNIATRGRVLTGDNVLIGGFVIAGDSPQTVVIRARGPSLAAAGVPNPLANPLLRLFAGDGTALLTNDDWTVAPNAVAIQASGFVPSDARESAILVTLNPGAYTAVVSGVGGTTGLAIVEVFVP